MRRASLFPALLTLGATLVSGPAQAAWPTAPDSGVFLHFTQSETEHFAIGDGAGGIVTAGRMMCLCNGYPGWRGGRLDAEADARWPNGAFDDFHVIAGGANYGPKASALVTDGAGGAFGFMGQFLSLYYRKTTADGAQSSGAIPGGSDGNRTVLDAAEDGAGGAVVFWGDTRSGAAGVYGQRIDAAGAPQWVAGGIKLASASSPSPVGWGRAVRDGVGGWIVTWWTNGVFKAQRVAANGALRWGTSGRTLSSFAVDPAAESSALGRTPVAPDGAGGATIAWIDEGPGLFAQRLDSTGVAQWGPEARAVGAGTAHGVVAVSDGAGGTTVLWDNDGDLWRQHYDATGDPRYDPVDGERWLAEPGTERDLDVAADGAGGFFAVWKDSRIGQVYAQHFAPDGAELWDAGGIAASHHWAETRVPRVVALGPTDASVSWIDLRPRPWADPVTYWAYGIHAQRLPFGAPNAVEPALASARPAIGFPAGTRFLAGPLRLSITLPDEQPATLEVADLFGRRLARSIHSRAGNTTLDPLDTSRLASGVYFVRLSHPSGTARARFVVAR